MNIHTYRPFLKTEERFSRRPATRAATPSVRQKIVHRVFNVVLSGDYRSTVPNLRQAFEARLRVTDEVVKRRRVQRGYYLARCTGSSGAIQLPYS